MSDDGLCLNRRRRSSIYRGKREVSSRATRLSTPDFAACHIFVAVHRGAVKLNPLLNQRDNLHNLLLVARGWTVV
jgi:hypothetical protein